MDGNLILKSPVRVFAEDVYYKVARAINDRQKSNLENIEAEDISIEKSMATPGVLLSGGNQKTDLIYEDLLQQLVTESKFSGEGKKTADFTKKCISSICNGPKGSLKKTAAVSLTPDQNQVTNAFIILDNILSENKFISENLLNILGDRIIDWFYNNASYLSELISNFPKNDAVNKFILFCSQLIKEVTESNQDALLFDNKDIKNIQATLELSTQDVLSKLGLDKRSYISSGKSYSINKSDSKSDKFLLQFIDNIESGNLTNKDYNIAYHSNNIIDSNRDKTTIIKNSGDRILNILQTTENLISEDLAARGGDMLSQPIFIRPQVQNNDSGPNVPQIIKVPTIQQPAQEKATVRFFQPKSLC